MTLTRTEFKRKPRKPRKRKSATGPMEDPVYLEKVRGEPCNGCGRHGPNDAHHCRGRPPSKDISVYRYFPGAGETSADFDAISLCPSCHSLFHLDRPEFIRRYGPDYQFIPKTRASLSDGEIDF